MFNHILSDRILAYSMRSYPITVGSCEGPRVGLSEGSCVGAMVGSFEGSRVGLSVGSCGRHNIDVHNFSLLMSECERECMSK